jgi:PAS domain S-box-containing protein
VIAKPDSILDMLKNILRHSAHPEKMGRYLTRQVQKFVGGKVAVLLERLPMASGSAYRLVSVAPGRHRTPAWTKAIEDLALLSDDTHAAALWKSGATSPDVHALLAKMRYNTALAVPLQIGSHRVGALFVLHLPDLPPSSDVPGCLDILSPVAALILRNAQLHDSREADMHGCTRELANSEERFRSLALVAPVGIFRLNADGKFIFTNDRWRRIVGLSAEDASMEEWSQTLHPDDRARVMEAWHEAKAVFETFCSEYRILRSDGEVVWVIGEAVPELDASGVVCGYIGTITDITERRRLENRLQQAQRMEAIGTLAGGIAHDFNNVLSAVMGYADMAYDEAPEGSLIRSNLEQVLMAANRAKELTKQILVFSRKAESKPEQDRSGIQIGLIVEEALKLLRATLPTTIEIRQNLKASPDSLVAIDPTQLHQVLMNLCTNASHAMRENGGILEVGLTEVEFGPEEAAVDPDLEPGAYLELTVSDTGHGMDRATIGKIFDPFFTTKPQGEGTGMGLSVVHGIVKSHGGAIKVYSEPGQGSVFHVHLPKIDQAAPAVCVGHADIPTGNGRILLVDDEKSLTELGQRILERLGYQVVALTSSVEALDVFRAAPEGFDLVITDYTMPQMTGAVLAEEIKRIRPDMPIILCTGFSEMITKEKAESMGARAFIMKPLSMGEMARIVSDVLNDKT